jgi:hypothetical protein
MKAAIAILALCACGPRSADPLPLGATSAECGSCHESHYDEWASSPHARSRTSPVLEALLPHVEDAWGEHARDRCVGCHAPEHEEQAEIGCISCHAAVGNHAERDGELAVDTSVPLNGPFADAEPTIAHRSRTNAFLSSPSLCGTCHELTGPGLVNEPTLTEYRASPQAAEGVSCADCHAPPAGERVLSNDSFTVRSVSSHRFVGVDPPWGAPPEEAARAAEETRLLLASALSLSIEPTSDSIVVVLRNVGAGHSVPTGATFLRDIWVDVEVGGAISERVIVLGDQPMREAEPVPLLPQADRVIAGSLEAGGERRVEISAPANASVTATLRARAIRANVLSALGLESRAGEVPSIVVATTSR